MKNWIRNVWVRCLLLGAAFAPSLIVPAYAGGYGGYGYYGSGYDRSYGSYCDRYSRWYDPYRCHPYYNGRDRYGDYDARRSEYFGDYYYEPHRYSYDPYGGYCGEYSYWDRGEGWDHPW